MKKTVKICLSLLIFFTLAGCTGKPANDRSVVDEKLSTGMQAAYDNSVKARIFTDGLLDEMLLSRDIQEYAVELTSGGFITDESLTYIVAYRYTYDGITEVYGYKLNQTENSFSVIDASEEIGEFIIGENRETEVK